MKAIAKLINKEQLRSNYKLTFANERGRLYLILHQSKKEIFDNAQIGIDYSFSARKGRKYYFINPQSLKHNLSNCRGREIEIRDFYYDQLLNELGVKTLTKNDINQKLTILKSSKGFKDLKDHEHLLILIKNFLTSFYFKHRLLTDNCNISENDELERKLLLELETL